ncbi:MAG: PQQ-binding-like beta-propeller repeat protein, partial [Planctomycetota bacterium]
RNGVVDFRIDEAASLWRFDGAGPGVSLLPAVDDRSAGYGRALESGRFLTMNPIVARGLIFVQNAFAARAFRLDDGAPVWNYSSLAESSLPRMDPEGSAVRWHGATYDHGRLFAVFGEEAMFDYGDRAGSLPSTLVCLDAMTGTELWRTRDAGIEETFSRCIFDPTPLVLGDKAYVVVRRRRSFGFEDCYLCRYDAQSGALEFRTHLGSASTGGFGFQLATLSIPSTAGGAIVVTTNLGTVAAVNPHNGRVRWLTLYRREVGASWGGGRVGATAPWHYNPVLADGDSVVCFPLDSSVLLMFDARTGEVRSMIPTTALTNAVSLVGIRQHVLYGLGDGVFAYDLAGRKLLWTAALPPQERLHGRGLLTADRLLVPTRTWLCNYSLDGQLAGTIPWESPEDAGNVLALPDRLIMVGNDRISAYGRKQDVWTRLHERISAAPDDPVPALEMAEVALRGGDTAEAIVALEQAVQRAGGFTGLLAPQLKRRVFDNALALTERIRSGASPDLETALRILSYAAQCAPDLDGEIAYRVRAAELHLQADRPEAAVELYQQMIADRSLRSAMMAAGGEDRETAGAMSRRQIDRLIERYGRKVYAPFNARAREWLEAGTRAGDLAFLERTVDTYPNAETAGLALIECGRILRKNGRPLDAVRRLSAAYRRYGDRVAAPEVMRLIADCYADAGRPESAWSWLTKAARQHPTAVVEVDGQRVSFDEYRARLGDIRNRVEPSRPTMRLPLQPAFVRTFDAPCHLLDPVNPEHPQAVWDAYYVYSDAGLYLFDAVRNEARWAAPVPCRMLPGLLLATCERAFFATRHQVFALDPRDGRRVWEYGTYPADLADELADHEMFTSFIVHGIGRDRLVSFQDSGLVACMDLSSGTVIWETHSPLRAHGPVVVSDLWVAYAASRGGTDVYCILDLNTGEPLNVIDPRDDRRAEQMFAALEDLLVVTTQSIRSYDPFTSERLWEENRGHLILAETVQVDLDGVYFSDDGHHVIKLGLENPRPVWHSDRLPFRFSDGLAVVLDRDQLIVSTEKGIAALDGFDGRLLWEGTLPLEAVLGGRFVTNAYVVAIDTPARGADTPYKVYFLDHRNADGRIAAEGGVLELGPFDNVKRVTVRDHALLLATDRAIHGWSWRGTP